MSYYVIVATDNGQVSQSLMVENRCVVTIKMPAIQALEFGYSIERAAMTAYLDQIEARLAESKQHLEAVKERHG
jgi:hypothetical protein